MFVRRAETVYEVLNTEGQDELFHCEVEDGTYFTDVLYKEETQTIRINE